MSLPPILSFLVRAWSRLPLETTAVALAAFGAISMIHHDPPSLWHVRLLLAGLLTVPLVFAARERAGRHVPVTGALLGATVFGTIILATPTTQHLDRPAFLWGLGLCGAAALLAPFVAAAPRFSQFVRRFAEELTAACLLGGLALLALLIVGFAIDELFDVNTKRLTADAMLLTAAAMLLVALDRLLPDRASTGKVPEIWRRLVLAIGAPFVAVMLGILVVYELTVLARGELPRNLLSPLILGAGFTGYLCTLVVNAILDEPVGTGTLSPAEPHRFLRRRSVQLVRAFPLVLLALLPMALIAIAVRIEQYGLTPFRVMRLAALLCLAVLGVLGTWRYLRKRAPLTWQVPALVAVFAIGIALGPTSAIELSIRSQAARLERQLTTAGVTSREVRGGAAEPVHVLPLAQWEELHATLAALSEVGGERALGLVLRGDLAACASRWTGPQHCLEGLGVDDERRTGGVRPLEANLEAPANVPPGQLTFFIAYSGTRYHFEGRRLFLPLARESAGEREGEAFGEVDLSAALAAALAEKPLPPQVLPVRTAQREAGVVLLERLSGSQRDGEVELHELRGVWIRAR